MARSSCLKTTADLPPPSPAGRVLVAYTLSDYIDNADVRDVLLNRCRPVRIFPGTLGGGDLTVCQPDRQ